MSGGVPVLVEDLLQLADRSPEEPVTFINTVPSALTTLLQVGQIPASVKVIGLAGEPLSRGLADRCYELPGVQAVYNLYGPTEDTVYSTFYLVDRSAAGRAADRPTVAEYAGLRTRQAAAAGPGRRAGGVVPGRGWARAAISTDLD